MVSDNARPNAAEQPPPHNRTSMEMTAGPSEPVSLSAILLLVNAFYLGGERLSHGFEGFHRKTLFYY